MADMNNTIVLKNNNFEVLTPDGFKNFYGLMVGDNNTRYHLEFGDNILLCTPEHKLLDEYGSMVYAKDIIIGDTILGKDKNYTLTKTFSFKTNKKVYELLEVEDNHIYYSNNLVSEQCLFLDEFAFVPKNVADEFWTSNFPTISTGGSVIMVSTPNGTSNLFHQIWSDANKEDEGGNNFAPVKIDWWEIPGRDEEWKNRMISDLGSLQKWNQEYGNCFLGSNHTLIDAEVLAKLSPGVIVSGDEKEYFVYEDIKPDAVYIASIDIAKGIGKDSSVIQIFRVHSSDELIQVATWHSNTRDIFDFAEIAANIIPKWNNPYLIYEKNGLGEIITGKFYLDIEYENLWFEPKKSQPGLDVNRNNKKIMTSTLKSFIENHKIKINNKETLTELSKFIDHGNALGDEKYAAEAGAHDDCVMSLGWAVYMFNTQFYKDILEYENINGVDEQHILEEYRRRRAEKNTNDDFYNVY